MSYSYSIKAESKKAAVEAVVAKVEELVASQPIHIRDKVAILSNADAVIELLEDDETKDVVVSFNGYISVNSMLGSPTTSVAVSCSAGLVVRA